MGRPAGGDGGNGGHVIFVVDEGLRTLMDFRYQRHFRADGGENGRIKDQHGANADDLLVRVPPGTTVTDELTGAVIADLTEPGQQAIIAKGGKGGRGNARFATAKNKAPDMAEKGEPGEVKTVILELRVLADVGLVGFPSVGKSTLLSVVSKARPKVAAYHFTTLSPNLGVVDVADGASFVMADLPGLIAGAHEGLGLGQEFLRHVERTKVIVHVVDMGSSEDRNPVEDYRTIVDELKFYNPELLARPQIVAANKMDIDAAYDNLERFKETYPDLEIFPISAVTRSGIESMLYRVIALLKEVEERERLNPPVFKEHVVVYGPRDRKMDFSIRRDNDLFIVDSSDLEKLVGRTNFDQDDAVKRFQTILRRSGVDDALRSAGAKNGDQIQIADMVFDFVD